MTIKLPELLLPAGDLSKAYTAFRYGADAIYCGLPMFSLRTRENAFTEEDLKEIISFSNKHNKKVYVTINVFPHQFLIKSFIKHLKFLETIKPNALILADPGVLNLAKQYAPSLELHLSVQSATVNVPGIQLWQSLGISRIILAREISLREVEIIHEQLPEMELEYFIHGSVCMAYSGRCLLSNFTGGGPANCGSCNHTCRWNYQIFDEEERQIDVSSHESIESKTGTGMPRSLRSFEQNALLEEEVRRGEMIPIEEDFHGTHIMSSRDMCMIEYLNNIILSGICSLKIEGRHKTSYYLATVTRAYRQALDDYKNGKEFNIDLWKEIHATANRGFFPGFSQGKPREGKDIQYESNRSSSDYVFCGIIKQKTDNRMEITVKHQIKDGDELQLLLPQMIDDIIITVNDLQFGTNKVDILHPGDERQIASIGYKVMNNNTKIDKIDIKEIFIRKKINN